MQWIWNNFESIFIRKRFKHAHRFQRNSIHLKRECIFFSRWNNLVRSKAINKSFKIRLGQFGPFFFFTKKETNLNSLFKKCGYIYQIKRNKRPPPNRNGGNYFPFCLDNILVEIHWVRGPIKIKHEEIYFKLNFCPTKILKSRKLLVSVLQQVIHKTNSILPKNLIYFFKTNILRQIS